jgi:hypothetical protein
MTVPTQTPAEEGSASIPFPPSPQTAGWGLVLFPAQGLYLSGLPLRESESR